MPPHQPRFRPWKLSLALVFALIIFLAISPAGHRTIYTVILALGDVEARCWVADKLADHGPEASPLLAIALDDEDLAVRKHACFSAYSAGVNARLVAPLVVCATDEKARSSPFVPSSWIGFRDSLASLPLPRKKAGQINLGDRTLHALAVQVLSSTKDPKVRTAILAHLSEAEGHVLDFLLKVLHGSGPFAREQTPELLEKTLPLLKHEALRVSILALLIGQNIGDEIPLPEIAISLQRESERGIAAEILAAHENVPASLIPALAAIAETGNSNEAKFANQALSRFDGGPHAESLTCYRALNRPPTGFYDEAPDLKTWFRSATNNR